MNQHRRCKLRRARCSQLCTPYDKDNTAAMSEQLSRRTKLFYGSGDLGFSLTSTILGAFFAIFLTDVVGISPSVAAAAIFAGRTWDYINDPLIGHLSDRTRSRWGRRRPFLLFGPLPFALAFMLLWWRPPLSSQIALALYYAVAYILFDAAATFVYMPYFALTPELTADYDERTALTSYRMFFSIAGSLIAFTLPLTIVGTFTPENSSNVLRMGVIFGIISALPLWLVFATTREREAHLAQKRPNLRKSFRAALRNRPFVFGLAIFLLTWLAVDILQTILLYFIKYYMGRESQSDIIMGTIFVTALLALPLWEWVSRRWGKRWAYVAGIAFWAAVQIVLVMVSPGSPDAVIFLLCSLAGVGVGAAHVLPWSIIPDAIEWDELQTGERHEGMFYSLITLAQKIASSVAVPVALLMLDATGYVPNSVSQPASALWGIRILAGPIPAVLLCAGIAFAVAYPLSRERYAEVCKELASRRASSSRKIS